MPGIMSISDELSSLLARQHPMLYALSKTLLAEMPANKSDQSLMFYTLNLLGYCHNQGHVALDLGAFANKRPPIEWQVSYRFPEQEQWQAELHRLLACIDNPPLVFYGSFLFLARLDNLEDFIAGNLLQRTRYKTPSDSIQEKNSRLLKAIQANVEIDWQKLAIANSLMEHLAIIIGGPGTGKTTTVASLLENILKNEGHKKYRVALAAPTGKAATRMATALMAKLVDTALAPDLLNCLPEKANTVHRLLGWSVTKRAFNHHAGNPLCVDCLVVDEVSMIDMELFAALLRAVPVSCRLILLGDAFQLPSVQAGSILADLCEEQALNGFSSTKIRWFRQLLSEAAFTETDAPLADNIVSLKKSYRFEDDKGIGALAKACLEKNRHQLMQALNEPEVELYDKDKQGIHEIEHLLRQQHVLLTEQQRVEEAFAVLGQFQLLCANKDGDLSTDFFNRSMAKWVVALQNQRGEFSRVLPFYQGMPVLMEHNRYDLDLYNGDTGLVWWSDGQFWFYFLDQEQNIKRYLPQQIQGWSPAHAITVHKSQGSEYDTVAFVAPAIESPLLTRELLYTAITRAKSQVVLLAGMNELTKALASDNQRSSALALRLRKAFDIG